MASGTNSFALAHELRRIMDSGEWGTGGRLPPERALAARFAVARNTLRRALGLLENEGYLTRHVGRGTFIVDRHHAPTDSAAFRMSEASPRDLLETRLIIEPRAAGLAATRASRADLAAIAHALEQSLAATALGAFERWDAQLHLAIFIAAKNEVLVNYCRAITEARNQPQWFELKKRSVTPERQLIYNVQHREIVSTLIKRDAEAAAEAMRRHLRTVEDNILAVA
jgi:DNA-binding FadR family transcriptional regulator